MAQWTSAYINDLPDSAFACIDSSGRHYPHHDASGKVDVPHLRNALSRVAQEDTTSCGVSHLREHASALDIGKADHVTEMKAEPMTSAQLDRWLNGEIPRRHLALPFGGPLRSKYYAKGMDLDGEFFHEGTDFYGPYSWLRDSRERLVDWHHVTFGDRTDPAGLMKGAILGRIVLDDEPSEAEVDGKTYAGIWADLWANAGEKRRELVAMLERRAVPIYGSSQPVQKAVQIDGKTGSIDVWPVRFHTITTSPQNTNAVLPPMKAMLDDPYLATLSVGALRAFLTGSDDLTSDLLPIAPSDERAGEAVAKSGRVLSAVNEADLEAALEKLLVAIEQLNTVRARHHERQSKGVVTA